MAVSRTTGAVSRKAWAIKAFKHDKLLTTCKFTPGGEAVLAGSFDGKIHRWVVETGEHTTVGEHVTWISAVVPGPSGRL